MYHKRIPVFICLTLVHNCTEAISAISPLLTIIYFPYNTTVTFPTDQDDKFWNTCDSNDAEYETLLKPGPAFHFGDNKSKFENSRTKEIDEILKSITFEVVFDGTVLTRSRMYGSKWVAFMK